ncbi:MAG: hypothetical protein ACRDRS_04035 [Pseudonocardiaceae bacterium]
MEVPSEGFVAIPEVLIVYEIPPAERRRLVAFQRQLVPEGPSSFGRLGRDVWARPAVGAGGTDVFHLTTREHLSAARRRYAALEQDWLLSRDARNVNSAESTREPPQLTADSTKSTSGSRCSMTSAGNIRAR